jgi:hypothetical protein
MTDPNWKLSPSDLTFLWDECPRCFYLKVVHKFNRPSTPFPSIFSKIDSLMKDYFTGRSPQEFSPALPPGVISFSGLSLHSQPVRLPGHASACHFAGRLDSMLQFADGTYGVVDFKTTSPKPSHVEFYGRQLHAYAYALENPAPGKQQLQPVVRLGLFAMDLDGLERAGLTENGLFTAQRDPASLAGYLELHIEQGPYLYQAGKQIGVVTGIVGIASYRLIFTGRANHAGTTPMTERKDAGLGAAAFMLAARRLVMEDFPGCVTNVGAVHLEPGAFNIVPGHAEAALECRSVDPQELDRLASALLEVAAREAETFGLELNVTDLGRHAPARLSKPAQQAIQDAATEHNLSWTTLPSGAGHDAQNLADLCPTGMIFIPSIDGISHSPAEFSQWEDCVNGANVLLGAAIRLAQAAGS